MKEQLSIKVVKETLTQIWDSWLESGTLSVVMDLEFTYRATPLNKLFKGLLKLTW
jgi:hypothetical protein